MIYPHDNIHTGLEKLARAEDIAYPIGGGLVGGAIGLGGGALAKNRAQSMLKHISGLTQHYTLMDLPEAEAAYAKSLKKTPFAGYKHIKRLPVYGLIAGGLIGAAGNEMRRRELRRAVMKKKRQ